MKFLNKLRINQWSFVYAGLLVGVAQVIYMVGLWIGAAVQGKTPLLEPITVTTDLGRMFRGMEVFINNLFGFHSELYGNYEKIVVDGIEKIVPSASGAFVPGIGWPIVGMILGGVIVSLWEKESRSWAHYSAKALLVAFIGGALFSYGTRLAGGCTLNHLMGGVPMMNIHSLVTIFFMALGGTLGFGLMSKLNLAKYFKHQETKSYVMNATPGEQATWKRGYDFRKNPVYWIGASFAIIFVLTAVFSAIINPESMQHLKDGEMVAFSKSISGKGIFYVLLTLAAGIIAGIGLSKSGFGTECALVSMETGRIMTKKDNIFAKMGVPKITRTLMRTYAPLLGIGVHWLVVLAFLLIAWGAFGISPGFENEVKYSLTAGSFIGGTIMGLGAVMLIGCEIRSYMRVGLGYLNTLVGFIGFAVGYLPFTLFYEGHKSFLANTVIIGKGGAVSEAYKLYDLFTNNPTAQWLIMFLWLGIIFMIVRFFFRQGMKNTGLTSEEMIHLNTESQQLILDEAAISSQGKNHGVEIPSDVPEEVLEPA